jgi:hypothetical protein
VTGAEAADGLGYDGGFRSCTLRTRKPRDVEHIRSVHDDAEPHWGQVNRGGKPTGAGHPTPVVTGARRLRPPKPDAVDGHLS